VGASSAGGGASGRGEERTDNAKAKIKSATRIVAGLSLITAAVVHWNGLSRPGRPAIARSGHDGSRRSPSGH